jgi:3-oxoacyl-[acyl-carrier-protein] synthase-1/3-oxoacyl-[acyl-carrier-protein] synthase II
MNLKTCTESLFLKDFQPRSPFRFSTTHAVSYPVFEVVDAFPGEDAIPESVMLRTSKMGIAAADEAIKDSGWELPALQQTRVGVCMGTTVGSAMNNEQFYQEFREQRHPSMEPIIRFLNSNPASCIAKAFSLNGPCQTIVNACSSSGDAIGVGSEWIRNGICDVVIAGGADELCRVTYSGFISLRISDDLPCKPFDVNRKGLNLGEGAAVLILESNKTVEARGASPLAYIHGYGSACDAYHLTAPHPQGEGLKQAIIAAMKQSGRKTEDVAFVHAHGTATPDNDRVEAGVLKELMPDIPFLSTKGYTGHTLGAAGAISAAFTVAFLATGLLPPSPRFSDPDPEISVSPITESMEIDGSFAISESLAFGGNNAVLIIGKEGG